MKNIENTILELLLAEKLIQKFEKNLVNFEAFNVKEGMTNRYFLIKISGQGKYILRQPGVQWGGGFSRLTENYNLQIAQLNGINTGVIYSNALSGLQILSYDPENKSLDTEKVNQPSRMKVTSLLKDLHDSKKMMVNDFDIITCLVTSYIKLNKKHPSILKEEKQLIDRLLFDWKNKNKKIVPSHNDPCLSNFIIEKKGLKFVDWEYSGNNFREWDLAFFSLLGALSKLDDEDLIKKYYNKKNHDLNKNITEFFLFKPIVAFLLMIWNTSRLSYLTGEKYQSQLKKVNSSKLQLHQSMNDLFSFTSPLKIEIPWSYFKRLKLSKQISSEKIVDNIENNIKKLSRLS